MRSLASEEFATLNDTLAELAETSFPALLIPPSPTADMSALIELRAGAGGSEASLFLAEMVRMYSRVALTSGWKAQIMSSSETDNGGMKDAIMEVKGDGVYDALRFESGVHRVQRVPATEASGRTHTSTVAVVVSGQALHISARAKSIWIGSSTSGGKWIRGRRRVVLDGRHQD